MAKPISCLLATSIEETEQGLLVHLNFANGQHVVLTASETHKVARELAKAAKEYYPRKHKEWQAQQAAIDPFFGL